MKAKFKSSQSPGNVWDEVEQRHEKLRCIPIPEGWITSTDYQKMRNFCSREAASTRLAKLVLAGLVERKKHPNPHGMGADIIIYHPKK